MGSQMKKALLRNRIKAAVFDLDETVLYHGNLSDQVYLALKKLKESGVSLIVATGRHETRIPDKLEDIFTHKIISNGAKVYADGKRIKEAPMEYGLAVRIIGIIEENGGSYNVHMDDNMPSFQKFISRKDIGSNVYKIACIFDQEEDFLNMLQQLELIQEKITVAVWGMHVEVTAAGVNKARGVKALSEYIGIPLEEMVIFGDGPNDAEMLEAAGYAVAMGNAEEQLKEISDYIAESAEEDGVAKAIADLFAI